MPEKRRRRSHEAPGKSSGQIVETTGRAEDRRRAILDEWFAKAGGRGTAQVFAVEVNAFVSQHAQHGDRDLAFNSQSISHYLAAKVKEGNKRVSKKAVEGSSKAPASWTIRTPIDLRSNMTTIDKRTLADLKASREQLKEILKFQQRTELPEVVDGEVFFDAGEGGMDVDGLRQRSLTPEYKLAIRNALYSSGCSQAKFPYVHATLVYFTVKELGYQLELEGVLRVVPTDLGSIVDFCADMDDHRLAEESKGVSAAFALSDKGDQAAGTSKNALTHNMATGYDHATGAPWGPVHLSAMEIERGGAAIAQSIVDDGKRVGVFEWFGSCTDSASDCIKGMVKEMSSRFPSFVEAACFLHVLNLVLVNPYLAAFGDEERGVCSALRIGYMMSYLHHHFHSEWVSWCEENGHEGIAYTARGAAKTRWWSVVAAFGDCYRNRAAYSEWCEHMATVLAGTTGKGAGYYDCIVQTAGWLKNKKAMTDMSFVVGFCRAFWDGEMAWMQAVAPWQLGLPGEQQKAAFRAAEMPLRVVLQRRRLQGLDPWDDGSSTTGWSTYLAEFGGLEEEQQEQSKEEAAAFLSTALDVHGRHSERWLTDLVDCSLAHHNKPFAVAVGAALLAIYDGEDDPPAVDAAAAQQWIDGQPVDLNEAVPLVVQLATAGSLREKSVLFTDDDTVEDIRQWVAAGGELQGQWGLRLEREFKSKVNGRPMTSHCVERAVNVASCLVQKCGSHEREGRISVKISAIINELLVLQRSAIAQAEREREETGGDRGWTADVRGMARRKKVSVRGKRVLALKILKLAEKAATLTPAFVKAAKAEAAKRRKNGTDRRSFTEKRIKEKIKNQQEKAKAKSNSAATAASVAAAVAAAAAVPPPKQLLNKLDLTSTKTAPSRAALALELEERGLGSKVKRAGARAKNAGEVMSKAQDLIDALAEFHGGETMVPKYTSSEGTKKSRTYAGDADSRAYKRQKEFITTPTAPVPGAAAVKAGAGAAAGMEEETESDREPQGVDAAL